MKGHTNPNVRSTEEGELVGPKMHSCVKMASSGPYDGDVWPSMNALAKSVGPNGSQDYGYRIIKRCRRKGLVEIVDHEDATPNGRGAVVSTEKGERYLTNHD